MISSIVSWVSEDQIRFLAVVMFSVLLFLYFIISLRNRPIHTNRSVSVGRDNYGVINTGDSNTQNKSDLLTIFANIATILAFLGSLFGAYVAILTAP